MNVKIIRTGEIIQVSDCYGARLVEQGDAIFCRAESEGKSAPAKKGGRKNGAD